MAFSNWVLVLVLAILCAVVLFRISHGSDVEKHEHALSVMPSNVPDSAVDLTSFNPRVARRMILASLLALPWNASVVFKGGGQPTNELLVVRNVLSVNVTNGNDSQDKLTYVEWRRDNLQLQYVDHDDQCRMDIRGRTTSKWWVVSHKETRYVFPYTQRWSLGYVGLNASGCVNFYRKGAIDVAILPRVRDSWIGIAALIALMHRGTFPQNSWLMWIGSRAIVSNPTINIRNVVSEYALKDTLVLIGQSSFNDLVVRDDVFVVKNCDQSVVLLESLWKYRLVRNAYDVQTPSDSLMRVMRDATHFPRQFRLWESRIRILPHKVLFSEVRQELQPYIGDNWKPNDFIALLNEEQKFGVRLRSRLGLYVSLHYALSLSTFFPVSVSWIDIPRVAEAPGQMNPSCLLDDSLKGQYWCAFRNVNYQLDGETGIFIYPPGSGLTVTTFAHLNATHIGSRDVVPVSHFEKMTIAEDVEKKLHRRVTMGFEDVRLIRIGNDIWGCACTFQTTSHGPVAQVLLKLTGSFCSSMVPLIMPPPHNRVPQKNWMPFEKSGLLHYVYWVDPLVVLRVANTDTGQIVVVFNDTTRRFNQELLGGSPGLPWSDGYLFIVHEKHINIRGLVYIHRFFFIGGPRWQTRHLSRPFFILHRGIEYVTSLQRHPDGLTIGFTYHDKKVGFARVTLHDATALFEIPKFWVDS
jgi:hypothetical protein